MPKAFSTLFNVCLCTLGLLFAKGGISLAEAEPIFSKIDSSSLLAQITPDNTVDTQVNRNGNVTEITGGETRGDNLFHSFQDFSIQIGNEALFNNADNISNIFSRVTGENISTINGSISANGNASLFIINPNGIVFGEGASLNIGGSFYSSTADSILFEDGEFSATDLASSPLLTINMPIGLEFGDNPGNITNRSNAGLRQTSLNEQLGAEFTIFNSIGLRVNNGETIAFVGGNVVLENAGAISAPGGTVELGGLSEAGTVEIDENGSLTFPAATARGDVILTEQARVNVAAGGGGFINVNAKNLELSQQSELYAGIAEDLGSPDAQGGDITINATESVKLTGSGGIGEDKFKLEDGDYDTAIRNLVGLRTQNPADSGEPNLGRNPKSSSSAMGNAGAIKIDTNLLQINDRAGILAKIYGQGNTDGITIKANRVELSQGDISNPVKGTGNAGNIDIFTDSILVEASSTIISDISGMGDAGDITVNPFSSLNTSQVSLTGGSIINGTTESGEGQGGKIEVNTGVFEMSDRSFIFSNAQGIGNSDDIIINASENVTLTGTSEIFSSVGSSAQGNAGNIVVNTPFLEIDDGSIFSFVNGKGDAGNIIIQASEQFILDGTNDPDSLPDADGAPTTQLNVQVQENGKGDAGNVQIDTGNLSLKGDALILTNSSGEGLAGNIIIDTDTLSLDNAKLIAETQSGDGGNINLSVDGNLTLADRSLISARASNDANGGNINIDADFTIAIPNQNSDIIANAFQGRGGTIQITNQGIFGIESRPNLTPLNDINASSEFGLSGVVEIEALETDPSQDLVELPLNTVDNQIVQTCKAKDSGDRSGFVVTGRGGLPDTPKAVLNGDLGLEDWRVETATTSNLRTNTSPSQADSKQSQSIVEADSLVVNERGKVALVAATSAKTQNSFSSYSPNC